MTKEESEPKRFLLKRDVYIYIPYIVKIESGSILQASSILHILFEVKTMTNVNGVKTFSIIPPEQAKEYLDELM
jgi:hypothetical protein